MTTHPLKAWADKSGGRLELARKSGVTWHVIDDICKGRRTPRADLAKRISAATGGAVSASALMGLDDDGLHEETVTATVVAGECAR